MKVLWADDQRDVIETLAPLLRPLRPNVTAVGSGAEALEALNGGFFDIAIVDLMMPPGIWGGLWLLEELNKARIRVPILVLSGEGHQTETIQALRLGIRDYVRKESVQTELVDRIQRVIKDDRDQLVGELLAQAPAPIAVPLKRYAAALQEISRLRHLIQLVEAIVRFVAFLGLAEARLDINRDICKPSIEALISPTIGAWYTVVCSLRNQPIDGSFRRYSDSLEGRFVETLMKLRNDFAHGGDPSARVAAARLDELESDTAQLLSRLRQLDVAVVVPERLDFDGEGFDADCVLIQGDSRTLPAAVRRFDTALRSHHPYLVDLSRNDERVALDLFPLLVPLPADEPAAWNVYVFDGIRGARSADKLRGTEPLRFIELWSNDRTSRLPDHPELSAIKGVSTEC